jgi:hypothetical protein
VGLCVLEARGSTYGCDVNTEGAQTDEFRLLDQTYWQKIAFRLDLEGWRFSRWCFSC